jgi:hypothetical protein
MFILANHCLEGDNLEHFDFPRYEVLSFEREVGNGVTNPLFMRCSNDLYVVKTLGNKDGPKVLINEFVCYKLAKLLDLPIPDAALVHINKEIIDSSPKLIELGVRPGWHFGSQVIKKATTSIQPPMLKLIQNTEDIPSIILFDQIIYNEDRTLNKGNLLLDLKEKKLLIIDHSHVFKIGAIWDKTQLELINQDGLCLVKDFHGHNYKVLLKYVNGFNPFNKIMQRIETISKVDLEWCFYEIPEEWNLSNDDRNALMDFLWYRISNVTIFLSLLKDQCPDWKGGEINVN